MASSGVFSSTDSDLAALAQEVTQKYKTYKNLEEQKSAFVDSLVQQLQSATIRCTELDTECRRLRKQHDDAIISSDGHSPYVLVLIDGNELIFRDRFLSQGDHGGRYAAQALYQAVNEYVFSTIATLPAKTTVLLRIYADLDDLCNVALRAGLISHASQLKAFVRGFCQDKALFDLIDVGMQGRSVVYDKMEENLRMYALNTDCKHILFGCEDGEVYAQILRPFTEQLGANPRITLLHGPEPDKRLGSLRIACTQMNNIFRDTKTDTYNLAGLGSEADSSASSRTESVMSPILTPTTSRSDSRTAIRAAPIAIPGLAHSRQPSASSSVNSGEPKQRASSWAMAAKKGAAVKTPPRETAKEKESFSSDGIRRNRKGQRIDPPTPEFKKDEVNRLKKLKLCNAHHLRHDCPYPEGKCEHDHSYRCTAKELETLKLVARMSACIHGSECSDPKCIYGHRCPFPEAREGSNRGKACINGDNCRFPEEMHNMDLMAVRHFKIT